MNAGAAAVDITPKLGTHLAGDVGGYRPAEVILDPLYARALVVESGRKKICLLTLDVTIIKRAWTDRIRQGAATRFGLDPAAILVHATQTHSAPSIGHFMVDDEFWPTPADREFVRGGDLAYAEFATQRAIEAIGAANARLEPVQLAAASGVKDGLAFNRRGVLRDGTVGMPWFGGYLPLGPTQYRYLEGPTDPEVGVTAFRRADGALLALLLHFTCHPVNVYAQPGAVVSADWPGAWCGAMRATFGPECVPLVLNGCCGNINPWPAFDVDFRPDHRRMGTALGEMGERIVRTLTFSEEAALDWRVQDLALPVRQVAATELQAAEAYLADHRDPPWQKENPSRVDGQWSRMAWLKSIEMLRQRAPHVAYEIQAFRIGPVGIVGLPGEPFVEGQLAIKIASPTYPTYVAHYTTEHLAYLPTHDAYARGGHEVFFCKVQPGALEMVVEKTTTLLRELFC